MSDEALHAPLVLEYPFSRTTGPVIGRFLAGLRERIVLGARRRDGSVICPPLEYDPVTAEPISELVEVGPGGVVETWTWTGSPPTPATVRSSLWLGPRPSRRRGHSDAPWRAGRRARPDHHRNACRGRVA